MKDVIFLFWILGCISASSQSNVPSDQKAEHGNGLLRAQLIKVQRRNIKLNREVKQLRKELTKIDRTMQAMQLQLSTTKRHVDGRHGHSVDATRDKTAIELNDAGYQQNASVTYVVIGLLVVIAFAYVIILRSFTNHKESYSKSLRQMHEKLSRYEQDAIGELSKQTDILQHRLEAALIDRSQLHDIDCSDRDHSLALQVASEITVIERNVNLMDKTVKGIKQIQRSLSKLKDNLAANGYDVPELAGKTYDHGMKVIVTSSIPDENIESGCEKITRVLVPQVNYNGKMIQTAQIEVSVGV